jgi:hypothetical protein
VARADRPVVRDPRDGSVHDDYVYAGWEKLTPGKRYGSAVPRIFTLPLRTLTPETSWGFEMIDFTRDVLGFELDPWQRWLSIHLLELRPGEERLRFATVIILVARQNGKSTFVSALTLFLMLVKGWPMTLGTAQDLGTAEELWEDTLSTLQDDEELAPLVANVRRVNGQKEFRLDTKERYVVKAASRRAGRGLRGNLILLDELREQQNWQAWAAITKTSNAQLNRLIVGLSNAGDLLSVVLKHFRLIAHAAVGDPDGIVEKAGGVDALGISAADVPDAEADGDDEYFLDDLEIDEDTLFLAEWSATPGCDKFDRDEWAKANPSLGYRMRIGTIASDARNDPEWVFRPEVLCQWLDTILDGPFPAGMWEKGTNVPIAQPDGTLAATDQDKIVGQLDVCIDVSTNRSMTYIAVCGVRPDGIEQAGVIAYRAGTEWVKDFLLTDPSVRGRIRAVTGQKNGAPVSGLMKDLVAAAADPSDPFTLDVVDWSGGALMEATATAFDAVRDLTVRHNPQPVLDAAASTSATKKLGDGFVIDRTNSFSDAAPLIGFIGALWLHRQRRAAPPAAPLPPTSIDADGPDSFGTSITGDLMTVSF